MEFSKIAIFTLLLSVATVINGAPSVVLSQRQRQVPSDSMEATSLEEILDEIDSQEFQTEVQTRSPAVEIETWRQDFYCKLESVRFVVDKAIEDDEENKVKSWAQAYRTRFNEISAEWKRCTKIVADHFKQTCETSLVSEALPLFIEFFTKLISVSQNPSANTHHAQDTRHYHRSS